MAKNTTPLEKEEQIAFVAYCEANGICVVSTQNGFKMPKVAFNYAAYSRTLKNMGLSKGFPDLIILEKNKNKTHEVLFIEMKRQKGGKLHAEQEEWLRKLDDKDYCVGVAKGCESAVRILQKYLNS
ncbi:TPA: hypothetical protein CPT92_06905 [Candidatus Gastranaerophilales bacterium HUM_13]|jgi:hypothetical protein|nr:MAG TPA: hypothetical protein CPT92_06905 [Candidatus Gastranaerophilales bacterium HUM_13]